jgi:hypothetical protein
MSIESDVRGCFRILFLYDVAEALDLVKLRELLGPRAIRQQRAFPRRTPEYVRFEHAPVVEPAHPITLNSGETVLCSLKYYDFAAVVVQFEIAFDCDWQTLLMQAARWGDSTDLEPQAREALREHLESLRASGVRPTQDWLHEEYLIVNIEHAGGPEEERPSAAELLRRYGEQVAQLVRGETATLAPGVAHELLESSISYYATDLVIVGSATALVYDRAEDATAADVVLEYAKVQLLEFRYYDGLMTRLLLDVYDALERKRNALLSRWSLPRETNRINTIRLDVMELTERVDNAIKFVSEVYYARLYRLAAARMGVTEYRNLVEQKLRTVGELYDFLMDQFNEARSFVIEAGILVLALLDVILLFRWR